MRRVERLGLCGDPGRVPTGVWLNRVGELQLAAKLGSVDQSMYLRALDVMAVVLRDGDPASPVYRYVVETLRSAP